LKVAIVGVYPRDPDAIRGGVEAVTLRLSEGLAALNSLDVHVVVSEVGRPEGVSRTAGGVTVHSIGASGRFGNVLHELPNRRRIAHALRALAPDVVHAHSAHREALGAIESGIPTVVTIHGILEQEIALEKRWSKRARGVFRRRLVDAAMSRMRNAILLSPTVAEHYRETLRHARTWVIENPVPAPFFESSEREERFTILHSGVLIPRKGIRNLLQAFARVRESMPEARLRLAGAATIPAYEAQVHATATKLGLDDAVDFLGGLSPDALRAEYARAAVFVLVSKQETLPVAIQEAMATGRPVVASPVGGVPHLVRDGESGFLVSYGEPARLADRLVELLRDDELRKRMGGTGRRIALQRFTVESVCRRTVDVYREVLASAPRSGGTA
jgi:glycosyltransferase involved in cell wall biosynthesis